MSAQPKPSIDFSIRPMEQDDIGQVYEIEELSYPNPWPLTLFQQEVSTKGYSRPFVAHKGERVIGYAISWVVLDEVHLMNIAIHPAMRRRGVGHALMQRIIQLARERACRWVTLEVRVSNRPARNFYHCYYFREVGRRKNYYTDNNEDAILMALDLKNPRNQLGD